MTVRSLMPWAAAALVGGVAAFLVGGEGWRDRRPNAVPRAAPAAAVAPVRGPTTGPGARTSVCVTRSGLCVAAPARAGDPCSCPHPLRGSVRGHIEREGAAPQRSQARDWPGEDDLDPRWGWDTLVGP